MNRGEYRHFIEIWENKEAEETNRMGDTPEKAVKVAGVFAKLEFRGGGLLTGRQADSVLAQTTQKFTYPYFDFPDLVPDKNWIPNLSALNALKAKITKLWKIWSWI